MTAPDLFHLPDLPTAGYATRREKALSDGIQEFLRQVERDRLLLLSIVIDGLAKWRVTGKQALGLRIDHELLDAMFSYLELLACRPEYQRRLLAAQSNSEIWRMVMAEAMPDIEAQRENVRLIQRWSPFA
jgi:hypothetical protein